MDKCCGNCKWHDDFSWACGNGESPYVAEFTAPEAGCSAYERNEKSEEKEYLTAQQKVARMATATEMMCQCAEECSELSQAALKMLRVYNGTTPVSYEDACKRMDEEVADVLNTIAVLDEAGMVDMSAVLEIRDVKMDRWVERLETVRARKVQLDGRSADANQE